MSPLHPPAEDVHTKEKERKGLCISVVFRVDQIHISITKGIILSVYRCTSIDNRSELFFDITNSFTTVFYVTKKWFQLSNIEQQRRALSTLASVIW